jgi:hypothetical protein
MPAKKKKPRPGSIAARKEELRAPKKKKNRFNPLQDSIDKPLSKSFKEGLALGTAALGPGKFAKAGGKVAKMVKRLSGGGSKRQSVRVKGARKSAGERIEKRKAATKTPGQQRVSEAHKGNRAVTPEATKVQRAAAERKKLEKAFDPKDMAKDLERRKRLRQTKEAAKKLTAKRKAQQKRIDKKK